MAAKGLSTIRTWLFIDECKYNIKSYPDLFGTPDLIEITDEEDTIQKFVPGVKSADSMEFTMNYLPRFFKLLKAKEGVDCNFELRFGEGGKDGNYAWTGQLSIRISGGEVNAPRDMVLTVFPDSEISAKTVVSINPAFGPIDLVEGESIRFDLTASDTLSNIRWGSLHGYVDCTVIDGTDSMACMVTALSPGDDQIYASYRTPEGTNCEVGVPVSVVAAEYTVSPQDKKTGSTTIIHPGNRETFSVTSNRENLTFEWTLTGSNLLSKAGSVTHTNMSSQSIKLSMDAESYEDGEGELKVTVKDESNTVVFETTWSINGEIQIIPGEDG